MPESNLSSRASALSPAAMERLIARSRDGFLVVDDAWRVLYADETARALLALPAGDETEGELWAAVPGLAGTAFHDAAHRAAAERTETTCRAQLGAPRPHPVACRFAPVPEGVAVVLSALGGADRSTQRERAWLQRLAVEGARLGTWANDLVTGEVLWDARAREIFGVGPDEDLTLEMAFSVIHPDDRARARRSFEQAVRPDSSGRYSEEKRVVWPDGSVRWVSTLGQVIFEGEDADRRALRLAGIVMDVTEQREMREALQESEARYRAFTDEVMDYSRVGTFILDADFRVAWINRAIEHFFGLERDDVLGKDKRAVIRDRIRHVVEDPERFAGRVLATYDQNVYIEQFECRLLPGEGREGRWLEHWSQPIVSGRYAGGRIEHYTDVTERKEAEEGLRQREREFTTMANSIPQLAWMAEADGWIFWYNRRWYEFTGTEPEAMQGWGWRVVHHPDHVEQVTDRFKAALAAGEPWEDTFPLRGRDGAYRWFLSRAMPIHDEDGRVVRWFGTNTDVTETRAMAEALRRSERELRQLNETLERRVAERTAALESRNRELQSFAYVASHDMQEPLRKIQSFADLLRGDYGDRLDEPGGLFLDRMQQAAARMQQILTDLLSYSRVATHVQPFSSVDLADVVQGVLSDLDMAVAEAGARIDVDADVRLDADANQMRQVLNHLLLNALKFRREDAPLHIRIAASCSPAPAAEGPASADAGTCRIVVEDNGIGFDEAYAERIFEPFERLHGRSAYPGTGMGLAICRRIAERHGGTIRAESAPGRGSRFIVELPARHA